MLGISYRNLAESRNLRTDRKLAGILRAAARIIAEEGYERATIRKVAASVDASIASLYYYFSSKEELLFQIQYHTFRTLLENLDEALASAADPKERIRALIRNHLGHFFRHINELKVCSHELETLRGSFYDQVLDLRKAYFKTAIGIVMELLREAGDTVLDPRLATMNLFGMLNWIYTWYDAETGPSERRAASQVTTLFLNGIKGEGRP